MKRRYLIIPALLGLLLVAIAVAPLFAQSGNTWYVQYYSDPNWSVPSVGMTAPYVSFNWGTTAPAPGMPSTNWTATMTSNAYFSGGNYTFSALADDEVSLSIDGITYINTIGKGMSGKTVTVVVPMAQGNHYVVVYYRQYTAAAYIYVTWQFGTVPPTPIPPAAGTPTCNPWYSCTCPTSATSVTTQFGNYNTCIQQNLPQSSCFVSDGQWNSPNLGSIQMEPNIVVWGNCTPDQQQCMQLQCNQAPVMAKCSKTGAGWFYSGSCPAATPTPTK